MATSKNPLRKSVHKPIMVNVKLEVAILWDDDSKSYIAFCPALSLTTYGDSIEDVQKAFDDAIEIFIADTIKKGTLHTYLMAQGWRFSTNDHPEFELPRYSMGDLQDYQVKNVINRPTSIPSPVPAYA